MLAVQLFEALRDLHQVEVRACDLHDGFAHGDTDPEHGALEIDPCCRFAPNTLVGTELERAGGDPDAIRRAP